MDGVPVDANRLGHRADGSAGRQKLESLAPLCVADLARQWPPTPPLDLGSDPMLHRRLPPCTGLSLKSWDGRQTVFSEDVRTLLPTEQAC